MVNHPKSTMFFVKKMNNCLYDISLLALHRFLGSLGRCKPEMENGLSAYLSSAIFITFLDGLQIDIITVQIAKKKWTKQNGMKAKISTSPGGQD